MPIQRNFQFFWTVPACRRHRNCVGEFSGKINFQTKGASYSVHTNTIRRYIVAPRRIEMVGLRGQRRRKSAKSEPETTCREGIGRASKTSFDGQGKVNTNGSRAVLRHKEVLHRKSNSFMILQRFQMSHFQEIRDPVHGFIGLTENRRSLTVGFCSVFAAFASWRWRTWFIREHCTLDSITHLV